MRTWAITAAAACLTASTNRADIITVDDNRVQLPTADYTGLQAAINAAVDGDEIVVYPGVYDEAYDVDGKTITIRSTDPLDPAVVEATKIKPEAASLTIADFTVGRTDAANTALTLRGVLIIRYNASIRHVIETRPGSVLVMEDCIVRNFADPDPAAQSVYGGVIRANGRVHASRCQFVGNGYPGLDVSAASSTVEDCQFSNSELGFLYVNADDVSIERCTFVNGGTTRGQPAVLGLNAHGLHVFDCHFENNFTRDGDGGAIRLFQSGDSASRPIRIERGVFYANRATGVSPPNARGGAIALENSRAMISDCVFVGNEAVAEGSGNARGGALFATAVNSPESKAFVVNCTFHENSVATLGTGNTMGDAIHASGSASVEVSNSIFRLNGSNARTGNVTVAATLTAGNPDFQRAASGNGDGFTDDPTTQGYDESANNDYGDLRLKDSSPAISAGDNALAVSATDVLGAERIRGGWVDQGAYESGFAEFFIDASMTPTGTGKSWGDPAGTLADLPIAALEGTVHIAQGTYAVAPDGHEMLDGAHLIGGYAPGGVDRDPAIYPVVLTGDQLGDDGPGGINRADNAEHVLWAADATDITLEGVTISGGNAATSVGGGIYLDTCAPVLLADVIIEDNDAELTGGLAADSSDVTVLDSAIRNNRSATGAAGVRFDKGSLVLIDGCTISGNSAQGAQGAGTFLRGTVADVVSTDVFANSAGTNVGAFQARYAGTVLNLTDCNIHSNTAADMFSAIRYLNGAGGSIVQSVIRDNSAPIGGAVRVINSGTLTITQSTIANNNASVSTTAGVVKADTATLTVLNSIIAGNAGASGSGSQAAQLSGDITLDSSLVEGWDGTLPGTGSRDGDPKFTDPAAGDFSIGAGSDAIDAGDSTPISGSIEFDIAGSPRLVDDSGTVDTGVGSAPTVDIGAYEFQGTTPPCVADLDASGDLGPDDIALFVNAFVGGDLAADCDASGSLGPDDIACFVDAFVGGCP